MKKIIVGLGNVGDQYENTRHNIGFSFLDFLKEQDNLIEFKQNNKLKALISKNQDIILIKPTTFMNLSGQAVRAVLDFYKIEDFTNLIVVFDDLDIDFGKIKLQLAKGPKTHNGLYSIYQHLKTKEFQHLRLGIQSSLPRNNISDYVLGKFLKEEKKELKKVFLEAETLLKNNFYD
jgi:PTH1 family peptidyl-tRNA hydrolase